MRKEAVFQFTHAMEELWSLTNGAVHLIWLESSGKAHNTKMNVFSSWPAFLPCYDSKDSKSSLTSKQFVLRKLNYGLYEEH